MSTDKEITAITTERLEELLKAEALLKCLERLGIKNWQLYQDARKMRYEISHGDWD